MGHHADPNKYVAYRDATVLQRRIATFVLVFSVMIIALVMTFSSVQHREAPCQDRAHEVEFDFMIRPDSTHEAIVTALQTILEKRRCWLDFAPQNDDAPTMVQLNVLDTTTGLIAGRGFRVVRRSDGSNYHYELRAVFDKLCGTYPPISMEVMANVDYERVTYNIKAASLMNSTVKYLQHSSLLTKEKNRVTTVTQLQSVFPGFHQLGPSTARLSTIQSAKYTVEGVSQVYFNGSPLDIRVRVQHWLSDKGTPDFWRVVLSTQNIMAERDLVSLQSSIREGLTKLNLLCNATSSSCANELDLYLR
ncbi:hypothetical protein conserved [Leishmania donovani]|uniref:Uncharacterized protein n=3 Tax=Leishmania donovani species complex TaxID=38574 RepID=A4IAF8_LEIIN|nr:conserved hypothetical protein [Leishmania infantum JPCM5]XP_003864529.1 hypothetical protein, conserved [Leishmania donovani]CAC9541291.1 hypothetical_protein_-_conserved [Leishmania infantum]AYU82737.1 hypothetical protein LdCL_340046400 [Leishmania donovani]TPP40276.1 hypothetical protein CGC21_27150 [Leishmania donovani]TPP46730.1 hypothetical protein CGC20_20650 [Leishmania donovani]CAJ1992752.1 hypothetical protein conserved [Leishmania donovani]|eukprot:XP_001468727.1 conserved hypothetical protein [Leishmania infantum JPCM5]